MAKIPIGNFGLAIAEAAPRVQIPAGAFDTTSGVQQLADTGVKAATDFLKLQKADEKRLKDQRIETETKQADTELTRRLTELQYDPKNGYLGKLGSNAVDEYDGTVSTVKKIQTEISSVVKDPESRRIFNLAAGQRVNHATQSISQHAQTQNRVLQVTTSEARAKQYVESAAAAYGDDSNFNNAIATVNAEANRQGELMGLDPASIALRKKGYESAAWDKRFAAARMADPLYALSLFQKNPNALDPEKRDNMGAALFAAAAPLMANEIATNGFRTSSKNDQEALALVAAADQAGIRASASTGKASFYDGIFNNLPADMKLRVIGLAKQQLSQSNSLATHQMTGIMRDAEAAALDGKRLALDPGTFAAFGVQAEEMRKRYDNSQVMADNIAQVRMMPVKERFETVARVSPNDSGAGYAEATGRANSVAAAVREVNQAQTNDPVAFTLQTSPNVVKPAFEALAREMLNIAGPIESKRAAAQAFAVATIAEQHRLGDTPEQAAKRRPKPILPNQMADAIAGQFIVRPDGGQGPAQLIQMQAQVWGKYWPQVYSQIAKDIGPTARVIANMGNTPAASVMSMNSHLKTEELKKPLAQADVKAVDEKIDKLLVPARETLTFYTTGGVQTFNDYDNEIKRLAYLYAGQGGTSPADAAKRAYDDVWDKKYEVRGAVRYPKEPGIDIRAAERGTSRILADADAIPVRVPTEEAAVFGKEYTAKQLANSLKNSGFFVTNGDDSGVTLWMNGKSGKQQVEGADGRAISYTWKQLQEVGLRPDKPAMVPTFGSSGGGAATGVINPPRAKP